MLGKVILLAQDNVQTPAGRVTRDAGAIDPASDDEEVVHLSLSSGRPP